MANEQEGQAGTTGTESTTTQADTTATTSDTTGTSGEQQRTGAAPTGFTFTEDRKDWIPPHRFREVNSQAQRAKQLEADIAERDRKIAALAGVQPADPKSEKASQVKAAFYQMFPQFERLGSLTAEQMEKLLSAPDSVNRAAEVEQREWNRHGKAQMSSLYESVAEAIGADKLNADQQNDLRDHFKAWFQGKVKAESEASGGESSATLQRYEDSDPTLLQDFVKRYTANWIEPARRRVTQQQLTRTRPVPNSQGRSQVTSVPQPGKFKSLDDRLDFAADQLFGKQ